jgi:hypothetical protein
MKKVPAFVVQPEEKKLGAENFKPYKEIKPQSFGDQLRL